MCIDAYVKLHFVQTLERSEDLAVEEMFVYEYAHSQNRNSNVWSDEVEKVRQARDFIHQNFTSKLTVEAIAKKVYVSQYHFSRIFRKHTRFSPYQYLLHIRLHHARKLMQRRDLTIKEITFQSGFTSIDYFSAAFTKRYRVCPTTYRRMLY